VEQLRDANHCYVQHGEATVRWLYLRHDASAGTLTKVPLASPTIHRFAQLLERLAIWTVTPSQQPAREVVHGEAMHTPSQHAPASKHPAAQLPSRTPGSQGR
jgi:hypothetical protein